MRNGQEAETSETVFESAQALAVIEYARRKRGDEAEYLWAKAPKNAILRRQDSGKWYAAILTVERRKLGGVPKKKRLDDGPDAFDGSETVEVLNLKEDPEEIRYLVDGRLFFPAYHMNKRRWYTLVLDGSLSNEEIFERLDASWEEVGRGNKKRRES